MSSVAAIVLAAGRSERMGAVKPLLPFGESTVIDSVIDYLRRGGADPIIVVLGHRAEEIGRQLAHQSVDFVVNHEVGSEMSVSIACGVGALPGGPAATLIALVDQPAVSPTVCTQLIARWEQGASLIIPTWHDRGGHPVLIDLCFRNALLELDPTRGLKSLFENHLDQVVRLPVGSPYIARDMDTWDDYVTLHRDVFGKEPRA